MTFASAKKTIRHVAESRCKDFHRYTSALDNTYSVQIEFLYVSLRPWYSWQLRPDLFTITAHKGLAGFALGPICSNMTVYVGVTIFALSGPVDV